MKLNLIITLCTFSLLSNTGCSKPKRFELPACGLKDALYSDVSKDAKGPDIAVTVIKTKEKAESWSFVDQKILGKKHNMVSASGSFINGSNTECKKTFLAGGIEFADHPGCLYFIVLEGAKDWKELTGFVKSYGANESCTLDILQETFPIGHNGQVHYSQ